MGQNVLSQSDYRIFKSTTSVDKMMKKPDFLYVDTDSLENMGWVWSKMGVASLFSGLGLIQIHKS